MPSRPLFEGDTALNLRNADLPDVEEAISAVEDFLANTNTPQPLPGTCQVDCVN